MSSSGRSSPRHPCCRGGPPSCPYRQSSLLRHEDLHQLHDPGRQLIAAENLVDVLLQLAIHLARRSWPPPSGARSDRSCSGRARRGRRQTRSSKSTSSRAWNEPFLPARKISLPVDADSKRSRIWPSRIRFNSSSRTRSADLLLPRQALQAVLLELSLRFVESSFSFREKTLMSMTTPSIPEGLERRVADSPALSPKIARRRRSSGVRSVSPWGSPCDQDVSGLHRGADADDPFLVEIANRVVADVRNLAGDLLHPASCRGRSARTARCGPK